MPEQCSRCGGPGRLTPTYWNPEIVYCPPCCTAVAAEHDIAGTWPDHPNPDPVLRRT